MFSRATERLRSHDAPEPRGPVSPLRSGVRFRVTSPPEGAPVTRELAAELHRVLERFAAEAGYDADRPLGVFFRPGILGHHRVGRAADIYAVGGVGIGTWRDRWLAGERAPANLGHRLYGALRRYGRWSQPEGYPVQLFGPWTRADGPWRRISEGLLRAHDDHIHVAR